MNFVDELKWRGMIHDIMPGTEELLAKGQTTAYVGIDPTADSLHVGHLVSVMMMKHFQMAGHKPIFIIGGATGMIGDPSGKSQERNLLDEETIRKNMAGIKAQLSRFIDFNSTPSNAAIMLNNYDWMKQFSFLDFIREIGKHITVNYMMAKDSVKKRLSSESAQGMSFTEFTYQLVQGYDFLHLRKNYGCMLQMGGSDQWGNITAGIDLIRKKTGKEAYGFTVPLITDSTGKKLGKSEGNAIWLDKNKTSSYELYQFFLNVEDCMVIDYLKKYTFLSKEEIDKLAESTEKEPEKRIKDLPFRSADRQPRERRHTENHMPKRQQWQNTHRLPSIQREVPQMPVLTVPLEDRKSRPLRKFFFPKTPPPERGGHYFPPSFPCGMP